jgi:hypothetical protein
MLGYLAQLFCDGPARDSDASVLLLPTTTRRLFFFRFSDHDLRDFRNDVLNTERLVFSDDLHQGLRVRSLELTLLLVFAIGDAFFAVSF